jgi:hypothetical protein
MAISLSSLRKVRATKPPRILIYGEPGIGKTSLAASFPAPVFLQVEDGTPSDLALDSFGKLETFEDVMQALGALYSEDHSFGTVVVDSISELQRLVFAETCARGDDKGNKKANIEDFGYGKGYVYAQRVWQEFIDGVNALRNEREMGVVLIAHSKTDRFDDPETVSYNRFEIDLHDKSVGAIERDMDAILLIKRAISVKTEDEGFNKKRAIADGGSNIFIHTEGRAAFVAKNRFNMPAKIKFDKGKGFELLEPYLPGGVTPAQEETKAA